MQTKLTLRMEETLIERAKVWAAARGVSVSQAVAGFFAQLPDESQPDPLQLSPWLSQVIDVAAAGKPSEGVGEVEDDYLNYLATKYR